MKLIVEDPEIQGGAAAFSKTRLLVHHIAGLLQQDISEGELREDYPHPTPEWHYDHRRSNHRVLR